jgi:DNA mismatch repair ATPase MutL
MPIAALPQSTAQAIGLISVLSDASSVVKELLDNALDASASSISVEVSQNTVDIIQVRDNGRGIAPEDHEMVCKRACTSKIQTLDDLRNVGGRYLGFRGEALASAAEMAGSLTVSTRIQTQPVGSLLKYDRRGELVRYFHELNLGIVVTSLIACFLAMKEHPTQLGLRSV